MLSFTVYIICFLYETTLSIVTYAVEIKGEFNLYLDICINHLKS